MSQRKPKGRPPFKPNEETRKSVEMMSAVGIPQADIAKVLNTSEPTLRKYFRDELDNAAIKANTKVGGALFNKAVGGDTGSMIWWSKTRMGWKEIQVNEVKGGFTIQIGNDDAGGL